MVFCHAAKLEPRRKEGFTGPLSCTARAPFIITHMARVTVQQSLSADSEGHAAAEELRSERYRYSGAAWPELHPNRKRCKAFRPAAIRFWVWPGAIVSAMNTPHEYTNWIQRYCLYPYMLQGLSAVLCAIRCSARTQCTLLPTTVRQCSVSRTGFRKGLSGVQRDENE